MTNVNDVNDFDDFFTWASNPINCNGMISHITIANYLFDKLGDDSPVLLSDSRITDMYKSLLTDMRIIPELFPYLTVKLN